MPVRGRGRGRLQAANKLLLLLQATITEYRSSLGTVKSKHSCDAAPSCLTLSGSVYTAINTHAWPTSAGWGCGVGLWCLCTGSVDAQAWAGVQTQMSTWQFYNPAAERADTGQARMFYCGVYPRVWPPRTLSQALTAVPVRTRQQAPGGGSEPKSHRHCAVWTQVKPQTQARRSAPPTRVVRQAQPCKRRFTMQCGRSRAGLEKNPATDPGIQCSGDVSWWATIPTGSTPGGCHVPEEPPLTCTLLWSQKCSHF